MIKQLGWSLRTTFIGEDPARPVAMPRFLPAIGVVLLIAFAAITTRSVQDDRHTNLLVASVVGALSVAPMALLWHRPLWAWRITVVGLIVGTVDYRVGGFPWNPVQIIVTLIVLFVVALREPLSVLAWITLSTLVVVAYFGDPANFAAMVVLLAVIIVLGEQIGRRRRLQRALVVESERGEMAEARQAVLLERTRIARELHDVVAHSMSLVAVRAETAPYRLADLPESAREEFLALAGTARESLAEMRRLLGVLRTDKAPLLPQPTLSDLDTLIDSARQAGMQVSATVADASVSDAIGLTVYRIVQEALSNAARHAPGAPVEVAVTATKKETRVEVRNLAEFSASPYEEGHGITGMRERVELLGGSLTAQRTDSGGFEVVAVLPT